MEFNCKNSLKYIFQRLLFIPVFVLVFFAACGSPRESQVPARIKAPRSTPADTTPIKRVIPPNIYIDTLSVDTTGHVDTVSVRMAPGSLNAPVKYTATDSIVLNVPQRMTYLYGNAHVVYGTDDLKASKIALNQSTSVVSASYTLDTGGKKIGRPVFKEGNQTFGMDSLKYAFKTRKGITYNTTSQQGQGFLHTDKSKIIDKNTIFGYKGWYTTCDLDTPHYAIKVNRVKVIAGKLIVATGAQLEIEGVPTPLYLPFFIFPITKGQRSGIIPPTYTVNVSKGLGLEGGGYYLGLGQYFDMTLRSDVYSYGSWSLDINPTYRKRYRYAGNFDLTIATTRIGDPQTPDFLRSRDFHVTWAHSLDSKVRPGVSFSASVNFGTSTYNQFNTIDPAQRLNNTLNSSINFSKVWQNSPFSFTLSASHSQNTTTRIVNIDLPEMTLNMNTIYPFQPKHMSGTPKWYDKIGLGYNMDEENTIQFYDSTLLKPGFFNQFQTGIQHNIPITLTLPAFKYLTISPGISYEERWFSRETFLSLDPRLNKLDTSYRRGFFDDRYVNTGISLSTALYGMFVFPHSKLEAIRHVIRPSLSFNYTPDLQKAYYYLATVDTSKAYKPQWFSTFQNSPFGSFSQGRFAGLSFGIDNNLEMKVFSKKDTATHTKKVKLLDGFGINGSYNMVADSFKLSHLSAYARTMLFDKVNISGTGNIDPYERDTLGNDINKYVWQAGKISIGSLIGASISLSTSFQSKTKSGTNKQATKPPEAGTVEAQQQSLENARQVPGQNVDFSIPWQVNLSYSLNFNKARTADYRRDTTIYSQSLNFDGSFNLTPKWKITVTSGFDFLHFKLTYTTLNITRDLHCWRMNISVIPLGFYRSFSITISPTAGVLQDLRFSRTRQFYNVF